MINGKGYDGPTKGVLMTESMTAALNELHLLKHPFYCDWMEGKLTRETLRDYAEQYYHHVDRFPRYLSAIHSNCESTAARREILENLNDEEGTNYGVSHPDLWLQFAAGVGCDSAQVPTIAARAAIRNVSETFFKYARRSFHEGLGALYAYEAQVPEIAESKIEGLIRHYDVKDEKTLAFFEVHKTADIQHRNVIAKMIAQLPARERTEAEAAAKVAAQALWNFLSEIHERKASA